MGPAALITPDGFSLPAPVRYGGIRRGNGGAKKGLETGAGHKGEIMWVGRSIPLHPSQRKRSLKKTGCIYYYSYWINQSINKVMVTEKIYIINIYSKMVIYFVIQYS